MRVKNLLFGTVLTGLLITGCSSARLKQVTLPSGGSIGVIGVTRMHFSEGPESLMLKYQTKIPIENLTVLRTEANEIWAKFVPDVEKAGLGSAILSANGVPKGFILTTNETYNFVFKKQPDGTWHCLCDDKK